MSCLCNLFFYFLFFGIASFVAIILTYIIIKYYIITKKNKRSRGSDIIHIGIFHPYCNAGGGGERVLWCAVRALLKKFQKIKIIIYTGDVNVKPSSILTKARNTFNVKLLEKDIYFVYLTQRNWVQAEKYPYFTLLGQSLGSIVLGLEALLKYPPDVFIDTMGYAFTFPIFRYLGGCKVGTYTHYPTISTDMLRRVQKRSLAHNNKNYVAKNPFLTWVKLFYYKLFAKLYSVVGRCADIIMVNSSWTENHIISLWNVPLKTHRIYPPCEVNHLKKLQFLGNDHEKIVILSVGQFRPEKDHPLQLQAMYELRSLLNRNEELWNKVKLVIVGSCRDDEDMRRMKNMRDLSKHLSLENSVEFKVNVSYQELTQCYQTAKIGLHTMWNEHFGISIVECMAAGLIMIANRSGGPLMDIIETSNASQTGFLAVDAIDYAECIATILYNDKETNDTIRNAARASVDRFSEKEFENTFLRVIAPLLVNE